MRVRQSLEECKEELNNERRELQSFKPAEVDSELLMMEKRLIMYKNRIGNIDQSNTRKDELMGILSQLKDEEKDLLGKCDRLQKEKRKLTRILDQQNQ